MALFASLIPYLILYPTAISLCVLCLSYTRALSNSRLCLLPVWVCVYRIRQGPAVSPHLPCPPGPRAALTALITMQWGGWPVAQTLSRSGAAGCPITASQHWDYLQGNGKGGVNYSSAEKKNKTSGRLSPKEKTGSARRKKSNYVVRSRWHYGCCSSRANVQQGRHGVEWEQENKQPSNMELSFVCMGRNDDHNRRCPSTTRGFRGLQQTHNITCAERMIAGHTSEWSS